MAVHGIHNDVEAVLCAGCEECEWRAKHLLLALSQMDPEQIDHAWRRAIAWRSGELIPNDAERPLFEVIDAFARLLSRRKVLHYGRLPGEPKPGFRLVLELGGTAMSETADVAIALGDVIRDVLGGFPEGLVWDRKRQRRGRLVADAPRDDGGGMNG